MICYWCFEEAEPTARRPAWGAEIHTVYGVPENLKVRQLLQRFFEDMNMAGYRMFAAEENALQHNECWEYGFVKVDKDGYVIRKRVQ